MAEQTDELKVLGSVIQKLRVERGLTSEALAKRASLSSTRLEQIEYGEAEARIMEVARLAKALDVTTQLLCERARL